VSLLLLRLPLLLQQCHTNIVDWELCRLNKPMMANQ
jgi:hypothetical protein